MTNAHRNLVIVILIVLAIFMISFIFEDKTAYDYTVTLEDQPAVYVTKYGECYHSSNCHYLTQNKIEKGMYEAVDQGYDACSYCGGYSEGITEVEIRTYFETKDYKNAFIYSTVRAVLCSPFIYLIVYALSNRKNTKDENCVDGENVDTKSV